MITVFSWRKRHKASKERDTEYGRIGNPNDMWYWNERSNALECRSSTPCPKSKQIRALMNKYQPSERLKNYRGAMEKVKAVRLVASVNQWSIDSAINRAYGQMVENFVEGPPSCIFGKFVVRKAGPSGYDENGQYWNGLERYFKLLETYVRCENFKSFMQTMIDYFNIHFKLLMLEASMKRDAKQFFGRTHQRDHQALQTRKQEQLQNVGMAYANMLLGTGELKEMHHMKSGQHRFNSIWKTDQLLSELILEFLGTAIHQMFQQNSLNRFAGLKLTQQEIKIELGFVLRTKYFDPYKEKQTTDQVEEIRKDYYAEISSTQHSIASNAMALTDDGTSSSDQTSSTQRPQSTREFMRRRSARLAAERRVRGRRPSSATLIKQHSVVIDAALKHSKTESFKSMISRTNT